MKLVVGLGNPGPEYETTRHNAGFLAIDRLADIFLPLGQAREPMKDSQGLIYSARIAGEKCLLIKPQTFMNNSGRCVGPLYKFYKCAPTDLIVIHDDVDLPSLALRVKTGGGTGGHNGLKSIDAHLGAGNTAYHRIRVGIGRSAHAEQGTVDWVLAQFSDSELRDLDPVLDNAAKAAQLLVEGNATQAMNDFNGRERPVSDKA